MHYKITNTGKTEFTGKFDGKEISIGAGQVVIVEESWARHVFAVGLEDADKISTAIRHGWIRTSNDVEKGLRKLAAFEIVEVTEVVGVPSAPDSMGPDTQTEPDVH